MRKIFIIFLISWAITASAVEIQTIQLKPTLFERISAKISTCRWHITCYFQPQMGTTITTITGTDTVANALKVIANANFVALNTGKFELSDWYATTSATQLVGVGTITTGTWNATALSVSKGGTGTTSPTLNYVMLGNGSSGLKVVAGLGTSGQFLTSAGASSPPTWTTSALSLSDDYAWTGFHTFASTTYMATTSAAGLIASSTVAHPLTLNGVNYTMPAAGGASSTVPMTDGSGNITWNTTNPYILVADGIAYGTAQTSTTTLYTLVIPAGTVTANGQLHLRATFKLLDAVPTHDGWGEIDFGTGSATTTFLGFLYVTTGQGNSRVTSLDFYLNNQNSLSLQNIVYHHYGDIGTVKTTSYATSTTINMANTSYIALKGRAVNGSDTYGYAGIYVDIIK